MKIRKTKPSELSAVMLIYDAARHYMRSQGNMTQWTKGYPGVDIILKDIQNGSSYVCLDGDELAGVFSLIPGEDPTYVTIYNGRWLNDQPYGTVHRMAVHLHHKGVASFCLDWCFNQCGNIKADTHRDNLAMQSLLLKNGFAYCGIIYVADGSERLAYQKTKA